MSFMARSGWHDVPTPVADRLDVIMGGECLATWNSSRGHLGMDGKRHPGGEWDALRATPIRVRRRLTAAGYLARGGMQADTFADMLVRNGAPDTGDPIAWYLREALRALRERQTAARVRRHALLARHNGHESYYAYRQAKCQEAGYASVWHYRKERGWT